MSPKPKCSPVTLARVYEILDEKVEPRLRRIEFIMAFLLATTLSPKVGGPSAPDVLGFLVSLLPL